MSKSAIITTLAIGLLLGTSETSAKVNGINTVKIFKGLNKIQYGDPNPFDPRTGYEPSGTDEGNDENNSRLEVNEEDE